MSKTMLIDAGHPEETRVVVLNKGTVEDFDFESSARQQLRGNIYLAKVTRVEPSLQAAFVEYGGNRHGFLAFNEIHPDYYQIPVADREALLKEEAEAAKAENEDDDAHAGEDEDFSSRPKRKRNQHYKIQEVIKRRQIMLIQVVKEERGGKGAALTTYLSLAGRYCVLMPNTARGGGISRKISNATDRKRLKSVVDSLEVPDGMGLIIRTAGAKKTKAEIKRDYDYLMKTWSDIRENTLKSIAPALIYEEETLVKRAIRDMYDKDVDKILVDGEPAYRECKDFVKTLMPSHAKKVQHYKDKVPLFTEYGAEKQLKAIHSPVVPLKSGGYLVINQTEALVAIDVNSGKATKERNIETTATKTNLEAAEEAARQMRLRDLAGLVVIDFIDMDDNKNVRAVEKRLKDALKHDRARLQVGRMSMFGLMEMSRQRRRTGVMESSTHVCESCQGLGRVRTVESAALEALRALEAEAMNVEGGSVTVAVPADVAIYILNEKRHFLKDIEDKHEVSARIVVGAADPQTDHEISSDGGRKVNAAGDKPTLQEALREDEAKSDTDGDGEGSGKRKRRRRRRRRGGGGDNAETQQQDRDEQNDSDESQDETSNSGPESESTPDTDKGSKRRRGGRRRKSDDQAQDGDTQGGDTVVTAEADPELQKISDADPLAALNVQQVQFATASAMAGFGPSDEDAASDEDKPKRKRPARKKKEDETAATSGDDPTDSDTEDKPDQNKPKRGRRKRSAPENTEAASPAEDTSAEDKPKAKRKPRAKKAAEPAKAETTADVPADVPVAKTEVVVDAPPKNPVIEVVGAQTTDQDTTASSGAQRGGWWQKRGGLFKK